MREFKLYHIADLNLCGPRSRDYEVMLSGEIGAANNKISATATFNLAIKNPCIDSKFVKLERPLLPAQLYNLVEEPQELRFKHSPVTLKTIPIPHNLCGPVSYISTFMD